MRRSIIRCLIERVLAHARKIRFVLPTEPAAEMRARISKALSVSEVDPH